MKTSGFAILLVLAFAIGFASGCSKDEETQETPVDDPTVANGTVVAQGNFTGSMNYRVSGSAKVVDVAGAKILRLENFSSSNGPDLKVYLASDPSATRFISLGNLRAISGNQNYDISGMPDLARFPYALIWCEQFGALFGSANLK